jgi:hypothetical protein
MPDRVIRDELLTSERYWSVPIEAQQLFVHLLLVADSLSRFSGKNFTIRSACYPGQQRNPDVVEQLLSLLHDADLIRLYHAGGERYGLIPRYRQRLRYLRSEFPNPPPEINDIKDLLERKSDSSRTTDRLAPLEVNRSEELPPAAPSQSPAAQTTSRRVKPAPDTALQAACRQTWQAYSDAYEFRHGAPPVRNAMANSAIKRFVQSVPRSEAAEIARYFVENSSSFYVQKMHPPTILAQDAAKLRTEWATGHQITATQAMQTDKTASRKSVFTQLIKEIQDDPNKK